MAEQMPKKKRKKSGCGMILLVMVLLVLLVCGGLLLWVRGEISGKNGGETVTVEIPQGASTTTIANRLEEAGVIGNPMIFRLYSRFVAKADGTYQYGTFELAQSSSYDTIITALQQTAHYQETVTVTFPEGYNAFQMGDVLEQAGLCTQEEFIEAVNTHDFDVGFWDEIGKDPLKLVRLEGYLFPDTYEFFADEDVDSIITRILKNFETKVLTDERRAEIDASGYTLDQLVTLSAIVQKESFEKDEMATVASVFINRLQPDSPVPRLESDTTGNYIRDYLLPYLGGEASEEQLNFYDSYAVSGIPGGCIANPGLDAIDAVLHPADTNYYYFVTDIEYTYYYGVTWQDHQNNIAKAKAVNLEHGKVGL
ncbi:endolytic transglycosylase MltG [Angelakisella massiliensis]|uniref:endolytic transglycosylase MltG n=1 Tax=Angelakisella massiliensis TaxID=1871018 RepID=UPI0008F88FE5|nr:endolytic transglycosylase MltG [Angelakisella massiliensis]